MRKLFIVATAFSLAACAQTTEAVNSDATVANVTIETAKYFSTSTRNVRVGNFEQGVLGTQYKARVSGKMYDCRYVRSLVTCQHV